MDMLKQINSAYTICFSGHRPDRLSGNGGNALEAQPLITALREELSAAVDRGKTTVFQGCMAGFDILLSNKPLC